jgi:hypothetical protein
MMAGAKRFIGIDVPKAQLGVAIGQTERAFSVANDETEVAAGGFDSHQVSGGRDITFVAEQSPRRLNVSHCYLSFPSRY